MRPGTESIHQIFSQLTAFQNVIKNQKQLLVQLRSIQQLLEAKLLAIGAKIIFQNSRRSPHITAAVLPTTDAEAVVLKLGHKGVYVGLGSACQSLKGGLSDSSLKSVGLSDKDLSGFCRFSFGPTTTEGQIEEAVKKLEMVL